MLSHFGIKDYMRLLEIGCVDGLLLHRIKKITPSVRIMGLDRDSGHIEYARRKSAESGIDREFVVGNALNPPFGGDTFDMTSSHTVIEHGYERREALKLDFIRGGIHYEIPRVSGNNGQRSHPRSAGGTGMLLRAYPPNRHEPILMGG